MPRGDCEKIIRALWKNIFVTIMIFTEENGQRINHYCRRHGMELSCKSSAELVFKKKNILCKQVSRCAQDIDNWTSTKASRATINGQAVICLTLLEVCLGWEYKRD
jgi:hypothetical protein